MFVSLATGGLGSHSLCELYLQYQPVWHEGPHQEYKIPTDRALEFRDKKLGPK